MVADVSSTTKDAKYVKNAVTYIWSLQPNYILSLSLGLSEDGDWTFVTPSFGR
jgi:hypothetical protein